MNVSLCWLANIGVSLCRNMLENIAYEFVLTFPAVLNVLFGWIMRWEVSSCKAVILLRAILRICSKQHAAFLCSFYLAFSPGVLFVSKWCNYAVVLTQLQFERIPILFYQ